jgi:hypothetical protein
LLTQVTKDANGSIVSFTMIQSSSGVGPNEKEVTVGEGKLGDNIEGYYKWDTKPDEKDTKVDLPAFLNPVKLITNLGQVEKYSQMANDARSAGDYRVADYYQKKSAQIFNNTFK